LISFRCDNTEAYARKLLLLLLLLLLMMMLLLLLLLLMVCIAQSAARLRCLTGRWRQRA